jgi:hypothetical protein
MTLLQQTESSPNLEKQPTSTWSQAEEIVADFQFDPNFIARLMKDGIAPSDLTSPQYADALSAYSESYLEANSIDQPENPNVSRQVTLIANAPLFVNSQKDLTHYETKRIRERRLPSNEWEHLQALKDYTVWFNQELSDYVYTHPNEKLSDINKALIKSALNNHPNDSELVEQSITDTTRGARTEAVTRQLLDVAGVPYDPGTAEQDRKGGDIIVHFQGHDIKVDIKSSLIAIADARGGYDAITEKHLMYAINKRPGEKVADHVVKLYPGFEDIDLGDSLGIKPDSQFSITRSQNIAIQLMKAVKELGY